MRCFRTLTGPLRDHNYPTSAASNRDDYIDSDDYTHKRFVRETDCNVGPLGRLYEAVGA